MRAISGPRSASQWCKKVRSAPNTKGKAHTAWRYFNGVTVETVCPAEHREGSTTARHLEVCTLAKDIESTNCQQQSTDFRSFSEIQKLKDGCDFRQAKWRGRSFLLGLFLCGFSDFVLQK